jgi:hypothetical protein
VFNQIRSIHQFRVDDLKLTFKQINIIANKHNEAWDTVADSYEHFKWETSSFKTSVNNILEKADREITERIDKISKQVAQNSQVAIPSGAVIAWYPRSHVNVPDGWALCNGNNSTPNLEEKFVLLPDPSHNSLNDTYLEVFIMKL